MLVADTGIENVNRDVNALISDGVVRMPLSLVEVTYSNSTIEVYSKLSPITVAVEQKKDKGKKTYQLFKIQLLRERSGGGWSKPYMVGRTIPPGPILKKNVNK